MINDNRLPIKEAFLDYLEEVPIYRWAAKAVKKSEDTIQNWRKEDEDFSDQCEARMAEFVKKNVKRAKAEFKLERIMREDFTQRTEITGKDGEALIPKPITDLPINVPEHDSDTKTV